MPYGQVNVDKVVNSDGTITGGLYGFKNRIINGGMTIDQRNAGASIANTGNPFSADRWQAVGNQSAKYTIQQSSTAPTGFTKSLAVTSSSAYSVASGDFFYLRQQIEGYNVADFNLGTANASTFTLSFWVRSSLTGTFGGTFSNGNTDSVYPFTYTINSANTWEQKTITVTGRTSGTWDTTNGSGLYVLFALGTGSTYSGTANAWTSSLVLGVTGQTSVVGTSGATWYITGVQLEKGAVATTFDYRPYPTELSLCYRYYEQILYGTGNGSGNGMITIGQAYTTTQVQAPYTWTTTKRAAPTISLSSSSTSLYGTTGSAYAATLVFSNINAQACYINASQNSGANMVVGSASLVYASAGLYVQISSEL